MKQTVKEAPAMPDNGAVGNGRPKDSSFDNVKAKGGNDSTYLTARLKRDAPDIAARLERGEFKSVRAAAIEAGIVIIPSGLDTAKRAFLKLSDLDRNEFLSWVIGELMKRSDEFQNIQQQIRDEANRKRAEAAVGNDNSTGSNQYSSKPTRTVVPQTLAPLSYEHPQLPTQTSPSRSVSLSPRLPTGYQGR